VLRDLYVRGKYRDVILPMTVLRRLDALLTPVGGNPGDMRALGLGAGEWVALIGKGHPLAGIGPGNFFLQAGALSTTFNALMPGSVLEERRSNWQIGTINVFDGGVDGVASTAPNTLFATQGVFAP